MGQLLSMHSGSQGRTPNSLLQFFPADFKHIFFFFSIQKEALQAPNHQPSGIPSGWEFHKAKFPREFQQRCSGSQQLFGPTQKPSCRLASHTLCSQSLSSAAYCSPQCQLLPTEVSCKNDVDGGGCEEKTSPRPSPSSCYTFL